MTRDEFSSLIHYLSTLAEQNKIYCVNVEYQMFDEPPARDELGNAWAVKSQGKERTITFKCMEG